MATDVRRWMAVDDVQAAIEAEEAEMEREEEDALVREALSLLLPLAERAYPECRCYSLSPECPKCIARAALASVGGETTTTKGDRWHRTI